jgi:phospholipid/cholesterol/gamma-HCH transport system substrate-binding protein
VYRGGPSVPDGAHIPESRTSGPAELDDIYSALNKLSVALGPSGANSGGKSHGALSTLLDVAAANLRGNGTALGNSIGHLAQAARTLAAGRGDLFGTVHNLQVFTRALAESDGQVRRFNQQLATVAGQLAGERGDLGAALHDLGIALDQVAHFVRSNAGKVHTSVRGLESITGTLVNEKNALNEILAVAPVALANVVHAYQPNIGVLATRSNLSSLTDFSPDTVCALLYSTIHAPGAVGNVLGPLTKTINGVCTKALGGNPLKKIRQILGKLTNGQIGQIGKQLGGLLGGGLGGIVGGSGGNGIGGLVGAGH